MNMPDSLPTAPPPWAAEGLSDEEAARRLAESGPNALPQARGRSVGQILIDTLREPMLALLLIGGVAYLLLGDTAEALALLAFATFSVSASVFQESRTENVLRALGELAAPRAIVVRDGKAVRVACSDVVEGDRLILEQGDRVPADALLIEARNLEADESLLTGESTTVAKFAPNPGRGADDRSAISDPAGVYAGTLITRGAGHALVRATGPRTRIGQIGLSLATTPEPQPRLRVQTARIVRLCGIGAGVVAILIVLLYGLLRGSWIDATLAGIAAGMSLLPEEFPVVLTVFLAMGAWRISKVGVLTRRAAAIETLGSATILCTDKTGTLTENRMAIAALWLPTGEVAQVRGSISDYPVAFHTLVEMGLLASASVPIDPMEVAFHQAGRDISGGVETRSGWALVHSYGLSPDLLAMSNIWQQHEASPDCIVAAKGAPEAIASLCRLDEPDRKRLGDAVGVMAEEGIRVLGVARATTAHGNWPKSQADHGFELVGLVGLADPVRPDVPEAIARCRGAGVRIIMITGDHAATAAAIARQIGLGEGTILTGADLSELDDAALAERLKAVSVFARVLPEQKLRIVEALKASGEVVAMTGDGVNDAPSLRAAHIGIAMGKRGTDVAREAAAIVLLNDDFGSIVKAIALGRRIYDNIRKAMGFIFAVHVPIAGLALLPLVTGLPMIFGPIHIAILEMIIDPVCATVFEAEREEDSIMQRPPRDPETPLLSWETIASSVGGGLAGFVMLAALFLGTSHFGLGEQVIRSLVFFALIGVIIALILANRSFGTKLRDALKGSNPMLRYVFMAVSLLLFATLAIPAITRLLSIETSSGIEILIVPLFAAMLFTVLQYAKRMIAASRPLPAAVGNG